VSFTPNPVIEFDPDARAFYIRVGGHEVERTQAVADSVNVDFDAYDQVVGVEILY
jgi:uncharacterized protein YuzE